MNDHKTQTDLVVHFASGVYNVMYSPTAGVRTHAVLPDLQHYLIHEKSINRRQLTHFALERYVISNTRLSLFCVNTTNFQFV